MGAIPLPRPSTSSSLSPRLHSTVLYHLLACLSWPIVTAQLYAQDQQLFGGEGTFTSPNDWSPVQLQHKAGFGRGLYATRDIQDGELLEETHEVLRVRRRRNTAGYSSPTAAEAIKTLIDLSTSSDARKRGYIETFLSSKFMEGGFPQMHIDRLLDRLGPEGPHWATVGRVKFERDKALEDRDLFLENDFWEGASPIDLTDDLEWLRLFLAFQSRTFTIEGFPLDEPMM